MMKSTLCCCRGEKVWGKGPYCLAAYAFLLMLAVRAAHAAERHNFILLNSGHPIGKASYTIESIKEGYRVRSTYGIGDSQHTSDFKVDANGDFLSGYTQDSQTLAMTSFQLDRQRTQLTVIKGGSDIQSTIVALAKPGFLIVPDFDPSAIQILLTTSLVDPHVDSVYYLVVPSSDSVSNSVSLHLSSSAGGMLDGKPVVLKHYHMTYLKGSAELYTDEKGTLMEADMDILHTTYARVGFTITHR